MSNQLDKLGNHVRVTSIQMTDTVNFTRKLNQPPMMVFFSTRKHKSLRVEAKDFSTKLLSMPRLLSNHGSYGYYRPELHTLLPPCTTTEVALGFCCQLGVGS